MIIQTNDLQTIRYSYDAMPIIGADGLLIKPAATFPDLDGTTLGMDGIVIPMIKPADRITIINTPGYTITGANDLGVYKNIRKIEVLFGGPPGTGALPPVTAKESVSIGTVSPANHFGAFRVEQVHTSPNHNALILGYVDSLTTRFNASALVGQNIYVVHRWSGTAELGFASLSFGTPSTGVAAKVRAALILTSTPSSGVTYAARVAANEVIWSRYYPFGSQVQIDFGGIAITTNGTFPPSVPFAPATGSAEQRLMMCFYGETNSGSIPIWALDVDLTYNTKTVLDRQYKPF